jgi:hypothetical protein
LFDLRRRRRRRRRKGGSSAVSLIAHSCSSSAPKQVRLEMRTLAADCIDTMLLDQASSLAATMLVVTTSAPNSPRYI